MPQMKCRTTKEDLTRPLDNNDGGTWSKKDPFCDDILNCISVLDDVIAEFDDSLGWSKTEKPSTGLAVPKSHSGKGRKKRSTENNSTSQKVGNEMIKIQTELFTTSKNGTSYGILFPKSPKVGSRRIPTSAKSKSEKSKTLTSGGSFPKVSPKSPDSSRSMRSTEIKSLIQDLMARREEVWSFPSDQNLPRSLRKTSPICLQEDDLQEEMSYNRNNKHRKRIGNVFDIVSPLFPDREFQSASGDPNNAKFFESNDVIREMSENPRDASYIPNNARKPMETSGHTNSERPGTGRYKSLGSGTFTKNNFKKLLKTNTGEELVKNKGENPHRTPPVLPSTPPMAIHRALIEIDDGYLSMINRTEANFLKWPEEMIGNETFTIDELKRLATHEEIDPDHEEFFSDDSLDDESELIDHQLAIILEEGDSLTHWRDMKEDPSESRDLSLESPDHVQKVPSHGHDPKGLGHLEPGGASKNSVAGLRSENGRTKKSIALFIPFVKGKERSSRDLASKRTAASSDSDPQLHQRNPAPSTQGQFHLDFDPSKFQLEEGMEHSRAVCAASTQGVRVADRASSPIFLGGDWVTNRSTSPIDDIVSSRVELVERASSPIIIDDEEGASRLEGWSFVTGNSKRFSSASLKTLTLHFGSFNDEPLSEVERGISDEGPVSSANTSSAESTGKAQEADNILTVEGERAEEKEDDEKVKAEDDEKAKVEEGEKEKAEEKFNEVDQQILGAFFGEDQPPVAPFDSYFHPVFDEEVEAQLRVDGVMVGQGPICTSSLNKQCKTMRVLSGSMEWNRRGHNNTVRPIAISNSQDSLDESTPAHHGERLLGSMPALPTCHQEAADMAWMPRSATMHPGMSLPKKKSLWKRFKGLFTRKKNP